MRCIVMVSGILACVVVGAVLVGLSLGPDGMEYR
jgi:hypothetical protein